MTTEEYLDVVKPIQQEFRHAYFLIKGLAALLAILSLCLGCAVTQQARQIAALEDRINRLDDGRFLVPGWGKWVVIEGPNK